MPYHKVKTGCASCKRRKVKCDEEKPHCQRCVRGGYDCEYVAAPLKRKAHDDGGPDAKRAADGADGDRRPVRRILPLAAAPPPSVPASIMSTPVFTASTPSSLSTSTAQQQSRQRADTQTPLSPATILALSTPALTHLSSTSSDSESASPLLTASAVDLDNAADGQVVDVERADNDDGEEIHPANRLDSSAHRQISELVYRRARHVSPKIFVAEVTGLIDHYLRYVGPSFPLSRMDNSLAGIWANMWTRNIIGVASNNQLIQDAILMVASSDLFYRTDDPKHEYSALRYQGRVISGLQSAVETDPFSALLGTILLTCSQASLGEPWSPTASNVGTMKVRVNPAWEADYMSLSQLKHMVMTNEDPLLGHQLQYRLWQWYGRSNESRDPEYFKLIFHLLQKYADPDRGLHPISRAHIERWLDINNGQPGIAADLLRRFPEIAKREFQRRERKLKVLGDIGNAARASPLSTISNIVS